MNSYKRNALLCVPLLSAIVLIAVLAVKVADAKPRSLRRVIADVDPGIDDTEGLVFLINADNRKLLKLEAIVVTEGNTNYTNGIRNVYLLLEVAGRKDIPVYLGATRPILEHDTEMGGYYGKDGLGDLHWNTSAAVDLLQPQRAFSAIDRLVRKHPQEITYMTMAPMSTLGMSILLYPQIARNLKNVYAMGGLYYFEEGEFNVKFDAEAVDIVLRALESKLVMVTWQAGETNSPKTDWYKNVTTVSNPVWDFMVRVQDAINTMLFGDDLSNAKWEHCDPIVPAVYLNPNIILHSFVSPMQVEVGRGPGRGLMSNATATNCAPVEVIMEIDYDLMMTDFVAAFDNVCVGQQCRKIN